ncbi:MAG: UDP-glucose--hexose-1-phosphate uridylyltransferase [Butyrivibrio sp.]|nr:UDP-glucose--hexose-1-phosphate uridylyltransferase [Butyrivibrio sp.]
MNPVQEALRDLLAYALEMGLIEREDVIYCGNTLLWILQLDVLEVTEQDVLERAKELEVDPDTEDGTLLEETLKVLLDDAAARGLIDGNSIAARDLFDTKLMGVLTPRPGEVVGIFRDIYEEDGPEAATTYYYDLSCNSDYIRRYRIRKDQKWQTATPYGDLDITINLSKPEKDPRAIMAAGKARSTAYPKCQLCRENEGYAGRLDHPARENHRIIPIRINDSDWFFQYSPYVYYNEHCIVFNGQHVPMKIDHDAFCKLFDFVTQFPHYFVGSNADLPIVGGSILSHDHFQGGHYTFAMARAKVERSFTVPDYEDVKSGVVAWPMSVIRLSGPDADRIIELADHILDSWRAYTDEDAFIYAETEELGQMVPHNTITPIARMNGENYELDLVLRNNITTDEHPLGVFHPHAELHHIKKENIGLIEVMGLAVLPSRLQAEMLQLKEAMLSGAELRADAVLGKHADWVDELRQRYDDINEENIDQILRDEIGEVFLHVLEDAGVYKRTPEGQAAFDRFIQSL